MENYAGTDVSLQPSSVCVVDAQGKILKEAKIASEACASGGVTTASPPGTSGPF